MGDLVATIVIVLAGACAPAEAKKPDPRARPASGDAATSFARARPDGAGPDAGAHTDAPRYPWSDDITLDQLVPYGPPGTVNDVSPHRWNAPDVPPPALRPLPKEALVRAMRAVLPALDACKEKFGAHGLITVDMTVAPDGSVTAAAARGKLAGSPVARCVEEAVRAAPFPASSGLTTSYPFVLR